MGSLIVLESRVLQLHVLHMSLRVTIRALSVYLISGCVIKYRIVREERMKTAVVCILHHHTLILLS